MMITADSTLQELLDQLYRPRKLLGKSESNYRQYGVQLKHLGRFLGHLPLVSDLNDDTILAFLDWLNRGVDRGRPRSPYTASKARSHILALWRFAAEKRIVGEFPSVQQLKLPERTPTAWTIEEIRRLLSACERLEGRICGVPRGPWWIAFHRVLWDGGERTRATLSIRWEWVDLDRGWLIIPGEARKGGCKSMRYQLSAETVSALRAIRLPERDLVFPFPATTFYWHYKRLLESAGLPIGRKCGPQKMRISFASHLEAAGGNATQALRHSARAVTERSYLDPRIVEHDRPADRLPKL